MVRILSGKRLYAKIPNPRGEDIGVGLLAEILRRAGISRDEWFSVL
jgi:hypothetical protein